MKDIKPAFLMLLAFTLICGGIYPAIVTGIAQALFPKQAAGSFITDKNGRVVGSSLIGQPFSDRTYFWPRPSATSDFNYNPMGSGGSNSGQTNPDYLNRVADRVIVLRQAGMTGSLPSELVQASASGLDPHITPGAAMAQIPRVAKARGLSEKVLAALVSANTLDRPFGIMGQPCVNVLELNLKLDRLTP